MPLDSRSVEEFYESRTGQVARRLISRRLREIWPDLSGRRLLGFGYATPYLRSFGEAERALAAMPADAAAPWGNAKGQVALVEEDALPFPDSMFDCLLVVHGLELSEAQRPFLRELWRVLAPAGRLMVVAPNRASLWAQLETSPFGQGQPYSRSQLDRLLQQSLFAPERWDSALFMPPFGRRRSVRGGNGWERIGHSLWPRLAGVHIVEATKSLYVPAPVRASRRRVLAPTLANPAASRIVEK
ncbi:MAG: methyltransferase domain-containing protein [Alphaproteobacteria bacterium]|nr:methyltransferase domain-containing protein [Alphaproteobacteria bacterium]